MRTRNLFFAAALAAMVTPLSAGAVQHHAAPRIAPADEYFGRLKMSILGIGNQLRDLNLRLRYDPRTGSAVLGSAAFVEDALRDWERKYPADPWLAKDVYALANLYEHVPTGQGRQHAARALHWLTSRYARTHYGRLARLELAAVLK